jgi:NAD(P)-dependent dehydrogenase (short-subunit alcohol dehydrogenase family)
MLLELDQRRRGDMCSLTAKTALVTGGGRAIGRAIVLQLAREGAEIVIGDVDVDSADRTAKEVAALGRQVLVVPMDVTEPRSVDEGVRRALERFGTIDILVNNAGVVQDHISDGVTGDDFDRCYQVNVKGIWNVTQQLIPHFRERRQGKIVNIASIAGRKGNNAFLAYNASKAAAINLTQSLAASLGSRNINVNAVCPGLLWTPMWRKIEGMARGDASTELVEERATFEAFIQSNCPLRREQTPEDIGHAVAFLVSERARNITGQALNVDGGIEMS